MTGTEEKGPDQPDFSIHPPLQDDMDAEENPGVLDLAIVDFIRFRMTVDDPTDERAYEKENAEIEHIILTSAKDTFTSDSRELVRKIHALTDEELRYRSVLLTWDI